MSDCERSSLSSITPSEDECEPHDPELLLATWEWTFTRDWEKDTRSWLDLPGKNRVWYSMAEWNHKKVTMDKTVWINVSGRNGASHKYLDEFVSYYIHCNVFS